MPNYNQSLRGLLAAQNLGMRVDRDAAALPQSVAAAIFNVKGGRVLVKQILGEVTTVVQNQANNTKLVGHPAAGTSVDLCAVTDIANLEVGGKLSIAGVAATALVKALAGAIIAQTTPVVVAAGTIDLNCASSNTGKVKWSIFYVPLDDGAYVEAA